MAWSLIVATVTEIEAGLNRWLSGSHGIGLTEYRAIVHLSKEPDHELRITELAERVGLNQSSTTRLVGRLEAKGLAIRDTCPDDGRGVYAVVTDQGISLCAELARPYANKLTELLKGMTAGRTRSDARLIRDAFHHTGDLIP